MDITVQYIPDTEVRGQIIKVGDGAVRAKSAKLVEDSRSTG